MEAIDTAFRKLAELRNELIQSQLWNKREIEDSNSDYSQFFMTISCMLSEYSLNKEVSHE